jgi:preprotein translocase subunit SecG
MMDCPLKQRTYGGNIHHFFISKITIILLQAFFLKVLVISSLTKKHLTSNVYSSNHLQLTPNKPPY